MSEERETPASRAAETPDTPANLGAPVEETEASETDVLEAVERATSSTEGSVVQEADLSESTASTVEKGEQESLSASTVVVKSETVEVAGSGASAISSSDPGAAPTPEIAEQARRQAISEVDTQMNIDTSGGTTDPTVGLDELPSASQEPARDGEIRVAADHPMAALYMQSPMPPVIRGNRGAGVLIALLATVGFIIASAGVVAIWLAPSLAPSQFLSGLTENLLSWNFIAAAIAFFVGLAVLVLIVGRAGWWAYVLGSFLVGAFVWGAATAGLAVSEHGLRVLVSVSPLDLFEGYGLSLPAIASGLIAREVAVWFGAWIGARGRRMKQRNAEALTEYEVAMAEVQANQP